MIFNKCFSRIWIVQEIVLAKKILVYIVEIIMLLKTISHELLQLYLSATLCSVMLYQLCIMPITSLTEIENNLRTL
jgi:hypothetical protein